MIDVKQEFPIPLAYVPKLELFKHRRPHPSTIFRWAQRGVNGVRLEVIRVGGTLCTSERALVRFCERLTGNSVERSHRTPRQRDRDVAAADLRVATAGG